MGKRLKVAIVGLPLFANKVAKNLSTFDKKGIYKSFNTYYSKIDKLKIIPFLLTADVLYSINGAIDKSKVFDLAFKLNKKVIMHWVGSDVIHATKVYKQGKANELYTKKAKHLCEVEWIKQELNEIEIEAQIQNFVSFSPNQIKVEIPKTFYVLSYLFPGRENFYGYETLLKVAEKSPHINFKIAGSDGKNINKFQNIEFLGWVPNLPEYIKNAALCIRFPEHDGLSSFVLESLSFGKQVLYKYPLPSCIVVTNEDEITNQISKYYQLWSIGQFPVNETGINYIKTNFKKEQIFESLIKQFK